MNRVLDTYHILQQEDHDDPKEVPENLTPVPKIVSDELHAPPLASVVDCRLAGLFTSSCPLREILSSAGY